MSFTVHALPSPDAQARGEVGQRTSRGRWWMLAILVVCAAPVVASYLAYFVVRPSGRSNYGELIVPSRPVPSSLVLWDLQGKRTPARSLAGQWLVVVVGAAGCDARCERQLLLQRQVVESLGRDKERVDKVWLVDDPLDGAPPPRAEVLRGIGAATAVLHADRAALLDWLRPATGRALEDHLYVVDPRGDWMMRMPPEADPARVKRDLEKLLRASAGWDEAGR